MSEYTAQGLADYATMCLSIPTAYMWGGIMRRISKSGVDLKAKQYPAYYSRARKDYLKSLAGNSYGCDCAGLIKSYYWGGLDSPKYNANTDLNTNGMYSTASVLGTIDNLPEEIRALYGYNPEQAKIAETKAAEARALQASRKERREGGIWLRITGIEEMSPVELVDPAGIPEDQIKDLCGCYVYGQEVINKQVEIPNSGTVTIRLMRTSPQNAQLQLMYNAQTLSSSLHGNNVITIRDKGNSEICVCRGCAFQKVADRNYGEEAGIQEWVFDCIKIDYVTGEYANG